MKIVNFISMSTIILFASALSAQHNKTSASYETIKVTDGIYMLKGKGGNIGVSTGEDGILIVDDGYDYTTSALDKAIEALGGDKPQFVFNTHWHGDHTGGNLHAGKHGHIVAHTNVRKRLSIRQEIKEFNMVSEPKQKSALPIITYDDSLSVHFNNIEVKSLHLPSGHTDGDSVIYFKGKNVVHMGDLYFQGMFPFIDLGSGGNVEQFAVNIGKIIDSIDDQAKVIPGHGQLSNRNELKAYHAMLLDSIKVVKDMKRQGLSLEQAQKQGLPDRFAEWSKGFISADNWIKKLYAGID